MSLRGSSPVAAKTFNQTNASFLLLNLLRMHPSQLVLLRASISAYPHDLLGFLPLALEGLQSTMSAMSRNTRHRVIMTHLKYRGIVCTFCKTMLELPSVLAAIQPACGSLPTCWTQGNPQQKRQDVWKNPKFSAT